MIASANNYDKTNTTPYSPKEIEAVNRLLTIAESIETSPKSKKLKTASPLAQGKTHIAKGKHTTTGHYTTNFRVNLQELHAFINAELGKKNSKYIEKSFTKYNDHHSIQYRALSFPKPVSDREWLGSVITMNLDDETIVVVGVPCFIEEKERPLRHDRVRAEMLSMYKLTKISNTMTRVDFYAEIELGGHIPRWIINRELPKFLSVPTRWQEHFQHQQKLDQLTVEDGVSMGIMLMNKIKGESVEERLEAFLSKNVALQQLKTTAIPQLDVMMLALLKNKLFHKKALGGNKVGVVPQNSRLTHLFRPTIVTAVRTLNDLTEAEATKIGRSFALLLLTTTEPAAAVDAWRLDNKVLVPLFADHAWFEPMINAIAKQVSEPSERALWKTRILATSKLTHSDSLKMRLASLRFARRSSCRVAI